MHPPVPVVFASDYSKMFDFVTLPFLATLGTITVLLAVVSFFVLSRRTSRLFLGVAFVFFLILLLTLSLA